MKLGKIVLITSIFTSNLTFSGSKLTFCESCNISSQKYAAERILSSSGSKLLIYDKSTEQMQKWELTTASGSEVANEDEPAVFAINLSLSSSDYTLKASIDQLSQQYKADKANDYIYLDHPMFSDASGALIDPQGYARAVYDKLVEKERWSSLQKKIEAYQNKKNDTNTTTATVNAAIASRAFTKGPGSTTYFIHITHPNGSTVIVSIDTTKDIAAQLYRAIALVIAKDSDGKSLPENKSSLNAAVGTIFNGNSSDLQSLADLFSSFEDVTLESVCAPQESLSCRSSGRIIRDNKVKYVLICSLGSSSLCN